MIPAGTCDGCGGPGAVLSPLGTDLCPSCAQKNALAFWASDQLKAMFKQTCEQWAAMWAAHPYVLLGMGSEAGVLAEQVMEDVLEAHAAAADVTPCAAD